MWSAAFVFFKAGMSNSYRTMSRIHITPPAVTDVQQPAFFLTQWAEHWESQRGKPSKVTLGGYAYIYVKKSGAAPFPGQETSLVATTLNNLIDVLADLLDPGRDGTPQTLGGVVSDCKIKGIVNMVEGNNAGQGMAKLPIQILVP